MFLGLVWVWTASAADVWLNELVADPAGADAGQEWVELWSSADVTVGGWRLEAATRPDAWTLVAELPPDTALSAGAYLVVADVGATVDDATAVRVVFSGALGNAGTDADAVRLVDADGRVVDVLAYGADAAGLFPDATAHADKPRTDEAVARVPDGARHAEDVEPTPGQPNPTPTRCVPGLPGSVRLTEAQPDPDGADAGQEWVELVVQTGRDLAGWAIEQASTPDDWGHRVRFTFPEGTTVAAGERVLVADADADVGTDWRLPRGDTLGLGNGEDAVRLVDCGGRPIDTLLYGDENVDGFAEDDGVVPLDAAPSPTSGGCLARLTEDVDQDRSALDWAGLGRCTPGASNAQDAPPIPAEDPPRSGCAAPGGPARPDGGRPGGGCATGLGSLGWSGLGAALIMRRRAGRGRAR
jgi:hypothetical protein